MKERFDVVVLGSGAAGLGTALAAAETGAHVLVLERSSSFGGTAAISGGQVWLPGNRLMREAGHEDNVGATMSYLQTLSLGVVDQVLLDTFVAESPGVVDFLESRTDLRFFMVERPDYHSEWQGAGYGRSLEPRPYVTTTLGVLQEKLRRSPYRPPLTSAEAKLGLGGELVRSRSAAGVVTQGVALIAGLLDGCAKRGVVLRTDCRARSLIEEEGRIVGVRYESAGSQAEAFASSVVVASGGFEWNAQLKQAFLTSADGGAASPPWNEGDGLLMSLRAGASVAGMTEAWWSAAYTVPDEIYDGQPLVRNIVKELALPGSILVNSQGRRFVNEASSYNDLGKAFHAFDPGRNQYVNRDAWLVFDQRFKSSYSVATIAPSTSAPDWFVVADSVEELAIKCQVDVAGLAETILTFNTFAADGVDRDFGRGLARHDRHHGDPSQAHPNLGKISQAPYFAVRIFLGNLGTKGGMRTDADGHVLDHRGEPIEGLFACGNAAASWMGPGYPGAGGSLGPILTAALRCGAAAILTARSSTSN